MGSFPRDRASGSARTGWLWSRDRGPPLLPRPLQKPFPHVPASGPVSFLCRMIVELHRKVSSLIEFLKQKWALHEVRIVSFSCRSKCPKPQSPCSREWGLPSQSWAHSGTPRGGGTGLKPTAPRSLGRIRAPF